MIFKKKNKQKHDPIDARKDGWNNPWYYKKEENQFYKIAIVLDGEVQEIITTETRLAALLLSEPKFIDISSREEHTHIGDPYNEETGEFLNDKKEEA